MNLINVLDVADEIADLAGSEAVTGSPLGHELAQLQDVVAGSGLQEADLLPLGDRTINDSHIGNHAPIAVVVAVKDHRLQGLGGITLGRRNPLDDRGQQFVDADAGLGAGPDHFVWVD